MPPPPPTSTCSRHTPHSNTPYHHVLTLPFPHVCQIKRTRASQVSLYPPPHLPTAPTLSNSIASSYFPFVPQRHRRSHHLPPQIQRRPRLSWYHRQTAHATFLHFVIPIAFSGVLVIRKSLITHSRPPTQPGGGTVYFVSSQHVRYMPVAEEREEAGTPNTLGCVRAGLAFALKVRSRPGICIGIISVTAAAGAHWPAVHCSARSCCMHSCPRSAAASLHTAYQAKIKREVIISRAF
jgi:hypothetical protein